MRRTKIAPVLAEVVDSRAGYAFRPEEWDEARRELRALLAVARAAERCAKDYDEEPYGIHRALARLRRASSDGKGRP